ncbi:MAG TPA: ATP-binding cassette domain-containing protein, partial [Candidatus Aveggerthella excrementigallinarum]|nr:ATP-binding cassette domain-containing protein [Candidatus Aveggerthella excrementigallinarum]
AFYDEPLAEGAEAFEPRGHDVVFEDVGFSYGENGPKVLDGVTFAAKEGEVTALVGPSGSGKSTCARLAARLWDATEGRVTVGGVDVATVDPEPLLADFSVVFQDVVLFDDTVAGNIRLGRRGASDGEVLAAARAANCDGFVARLPQGYGTPIGENGARLSGGERQRISIARALLKDAPIVLLDEATASLDVENETEVQSALSRLLAGRTVIVIAHRMRTVMAADKVVVLDEGRVVEQGSPQELLAANGLFARMVRLQAESAEWAI